MAILIFMPLIAFMPSFAEDMENKVIKNENAENKNTETKVIDNKNTENKTENIIPKNDKNILNWYTSIIEASDIAKKENKFILIDFCADWCEACKDLDKYTYTNEDVINEIKANFITIKLDISKTPSLSEILSKYNVSALPTILFFNKDINIPIDYKMIGFNKSEDFLKMLKEVAKL